MKIKQTITYGVAFVEPDECICIDGTHYRTKREAMQELRKYHQRGMDDAFVVKSTVERVMIPTTAKKRKAA